MVGEWDMVKVVMGVVGVKRAPPAISALHSDYPFCRPVNRAAISRRPEAVESKSYRRRIIQIGVIGVFKLESPATGTQPRAGRCPVANHLEDLLTLEPIERRAAAFLPPFRLTNVSKWAAVAYGHGGGRP